MKITCDVEITNRLYTGRNTRNRRKSTFANLALCHKSQKPEDRIGKNVCLYVITNQNPKGTKYGIFRNLETLFNKYTNEGKATLRFKDPPHDVIISKAEPLQLRSFLRAVGLTLIGQADGKFNFLAPPKKLDRPKQKMSIMKRANYPINSEFPSSLKSLQILNCSLARIDRRIFKLENLQVLDLSNNAISELCLELKNMPLKELMLSNNNLKTFPSELAKGILGQTLQVLDLSFNKIVDLSPYICVMGKLTVLTLKHNQLNRLPRNIHCLKSLKVLSASHNNLKSLPFSIKKLQLNMIDLFHNPLDTDVALKSNVHFDVISLLDHAANTILQSNMHFTERDVPTRLINYMNAHTVCPCGRKVFHSTSSCILVLDLYKLASTVVYVHNTSRFKVPMEVYFCSVKCWRKIQYKKGAV